MRAQPARGFFQLQQQLLGKRALGASAEQQPITQTDHNLLGQNLPWAGASGAATTIYLGAPAGCPCPSPTPRQDRAWSQDSPPMQQTSPRAARCQTTNEGERRASGSVRECGRMGRKGLERKN